MTHIKDTWDLTSLYSGINDPKMDLEIKAAEEATWKFIKTWKDRADYLESAEILKQALDDYEAWQRDFGLSANAGYYITYTYYTNKDNAEITTKFKSVTGKTRELATEIQFFGLSLKNISPENQLTFVSDPLLKDYEHYLERTFASAEHQLGDEAEKVMTMFGGVGYENWVDMLEVKLNIIEKEFIVDGKVQKGTLDVFLNNLSDDSEEIRDVSADKINEILAENTFMAEKELNSVLEYKKAEDTLRKFSRPDSERHLSDDVDSEVIDALVQAVTDNMDIPQVYYQKKAKKLGKKQLKYHERNLKVGEYKQKFTWEETSALVLKVLHDIDPEFKTIVEEMIQNGQIDVYPRLGKHGGAFCSIGSNREPILILLNFDGSVRNACTFAHEAGHAINHYYYNNFQNTLNAHGTMFTAEVCSIFMEDFVLRELKTQLKSNADAQEVLSYTSIDDAVGSVFRQIACYNFETNLHSEYREKGYLSEQEIGTIFQKHMASYTGSGVSLDEGSQNWWIYWGHIRSPFYVYSYASGLLISKIMQRRYREDSSFIEKIKDFMKAGVSKSSRQAFADMGIDITQKSFWQEGIDEIRAEVEGLA
jgi:oligoendopeptidase F